MPRKKIAILVAGLPPLCNGGTEISTVALAKCASKKNEVHIIAGTTEDGEYKIEGLNIHTVKTVKRSYLQGLFYVPGAVQCIRKIKPDVIHAQGIQMALSAFVASKITKIPYIYYGRGEIYMKWFGKSLLSKILMNGADRVIAQTVDMAEEMGYYTYKNIEVIPNGIDSERFDFNMNAKSSWLKVAVAVGRARPEKNLACFVDAMRYLQDELKFDHAMGVIIGDGEQIPELKKRAEGVNIRFMGAVDNSEIPMILKSADVLVNTSLSEGFPMAVLEAYASGLPVVVPRVGGMEEIVQNLVNGLLFHPNDYRGCALAIQQIFTKPDMARLFSRNNLLKVKDYNWDSVVERLYKCAE
jgi:glycosyltransferase involved in cell wall biosynthesis